MRLRVMCLLLLRSCFFRGGGMNRVGGYSLSVICIPVHLCSTDDRR